MEGQRVKPVQDQGSEAWRGGGRGRGECTWRHLCSVRWVCAGVWVQGPATAGWVAAARSGQRQRIERLQISIQAGARCNLGRGQETGGAEVG